MQERVHLNCTNIVLLNCRQEGLVGGTKSNDNKKVFLEKGIRDHRCLRQKKGKNTFKDGLVLILLGGGLQGFCCFGFFLIGAICFSRGKKRKPDMIFSQCHEGFQCNPFCIQFLAITYVWCQKKWIVCFKKRDSLILLLSSAVLVCTCSSLGSF